MPVTVALLDVDYTLSFPSETDDDEYDINTNLLDSLKKYNINDIYLFTDMRLMDCWMTHRNQLVNYLESQGFTVHGVITPNDLLWNPLPETGAPPFPDDFSQQKPGRGFREANEEILKHGKLTEQTQQRSQYIARELMPQRRKERQLKHVKGLMFQLFLTHRPDWADSIVIIDDKKSVIESICQIKDSAAQLGLTVPPLSFLQVTTKELETAYYDKILADHQSKNKLSSQSVFRSVKTASTPPNAATTYVVEIQGEGHPFPG
ncbi:MULTISPECIES: hypothetical protein [unclassified Legionella]|uniref:hypothetical protein n=1 Tax=unclassified Legionella TaxID=2622702 RepID=UPI0010552A8A|nr:MULTISPECIES: hypothetical protein [unclassified Legionella]MDI9819176.1 hypothetical protein [Legionella sp. PL877]